jgi:hypothetical protein
MSFRRPMKGTAVSLHQSRITLMEDHPRDDGEG